MKHVKRPKQTERAAILDEVGQAWRRLSGAIAAFQSFAAAELGLAPGDLKAFDLLARSGPVTAGELAKLCGLTAGAVTGLLARLEGAGLLLREKDLADSRRLVLRAREDGGPLPSLLHALRSVAATYSEAELRVIIEFMHRSEEVLRRRATRSSLTMSRKLE